MEAIKAILLQDIENPKLKLLAVALECCPEAQSGDLAAMTGIEAHRINEAKAALVAKKAPKARSIGKPVFGQKINPEKVPPAIEFVIAYARERGVPESRAQDFIDHYNLAHWKYGRARTPIVDWKSAFRLFTSKDVGKAQAASSSNMGGSAGGEKPEWRIRNERRAAGIREEIKRKEQRISYVMKERGECLEVQELRRDIERLKGECSKMGEPWS